MNDTLKKLLFFTVGFASISQDKIKDLIEDLVMNSDYTHDEGERIVKEILFQIEKRTGKISSDFWTLVDDFLKTMHLPERENINETFEDVRQFVSEFLRKNKENLPAKREL